MILEKEIKSRLAEFSEVYGELESLLAELRELQQAELAKADYQQEVAELDAEILRLTNRQNELKTSKRQTQMSAVAVQRPPLNVPGIGPYKPQPAGTPHPTVQNQTAISTARIELKKLIGRWGRVWKLSGDVQGRINRIADDPSRPLGEALALLDWTTFEKPIGTGESPEDHRDRIVFWGNSLMDYRDRLQGQIDMLKTKYRRVIPILQAWIARTTEEGQKNWERQIAETKAAKSDEIEKLKQEIAQAELSQSESN